MKQRERIGQRSTSTFDRVSSPVAMVVTKYAKPAAGAT